MADATLGNLSATVDYMRAHLWLGRALEAKGDKVAACAAYEVIPGRWGHAKPRSVTADKAQERKKALGCERLTPPSDR